MRIDGRLDEAAYGSVRPASGFIQMEPKAGQPASEKTEVWVFYDDDSVYVAFRAWESEPGRRIANEMRRDSNNIRQGDSVEFAFDTFRDRRNAILFEANPLGGRTELQSVNERQFSPDWNPVWSLTAGVFEGGWTIESAVPFKSIRYAPGTVQDWGFKPVAVKAKNEIAYLTQLPPSRGSGRADLSASLYASLVGLEAPLISGLRVKSTPIADSPRITRRTPKRTDDITATSALSEDASRRTSPWISPTTPIRTVEADEQHVNSRASAVLPEKRDSFSRIRGYSLWNNTFSGAPLQHF